MTPEDFIEQIQHVLSGKLRSAVLYGSAATGDFDPGTSDYNLLVIVETLGFAELNAVMAPVARWTRAGYRPPLLFTPGQWKASADVFPIEFSDIRQSHRVLFGEDPLAELKVDGEHLRLQLERELKEKLLALREGYLLTGGRPKRVLQLLVSSLNGFLVLLRAALRLFREDVPAAKLDAARQLAEHIAFDPGALVEVHELKHRRRPARAVNAEALFDSYLKTIEQVVEAIDRHLHPEKSGSSDGKAYLMGGKT